MLIRLSTGEPDIHLVLDEKPTRIDQKLKTLSQYVQQYPSGWKKRLELAKKLSAMGRIEQAVEEALNASNLWYERVLVLEAGLMGASSEENQNSL